MCEYERSHIRYTVHCALGYLPLFDDSNSIDDSKELSNKKNLLFTILFSKNAYEIS